MSKSAKKTRSQSKSEISALLIIAVSVSLTFWIPHIDSFNISKFTVLVLGTLILGLIMLTSKRISRNFAISQVLIVLFMILLVINLLTSNNFYKTLLGAQGRNNGVITYFCLSVLAFYASTKFTLRDLPKLLWSLFSLGVLQAAYNSVQLADVDPVAWNNPYGLILGTLGNSDFAAALLAICLVATMWLATMNSKNKALALLLVTVCLIELVILIQSNVRQSLVLFAFGFSILIYSQLRVRYQKLSVAWASAAFGAGILAVLGSLQIGPLSSLIFKESITYRGDYWRAAWRMFIDQPIFGVGLGNYGDYFNQYRDLLQVGRRGPAVGSDVAHSIPLDFLAMGGITLGGAYLLLVAFSLYLVARKFKKSSGSEQTGVLIIFSLLGCYLLQSLISIDQLGLAVWGWIFIGIALSLTVDKESDKSSKQKVKVFSSLSVLTTFLSLVLVAIPNWRADTALKQLAQIPSEQAGIDVRLIRLDFAKKLVEIVPSNSQYKTQAALYLLSNGQAEGIEYAKSAIEQNPRDSSAYRFLILAYGDLQDEANVAKYREESLKIDPFNPDLR